MSEEDERNPLKTEFKEHVAMEDELAMEHYTQTDPSTPPDRTERGRLSGPPPGTAAYRRISARQIVAVILSLFPGLGHVYLGLYRRGIVFFLFAVGALYLNTAGLTSMVVLFVWLFNMLDAYRQATLIEAGHVSEDAADPVATARVAVLAGVGVSIAGLLALLDLTFGYDLELLWQLWPAGVLAVGVWLIVGGLLRGARARRGDRW